MEKERTNVAVSEAAARDDNNQLLLQTGDEKQDM